MALKLLPALIFLFVSTLCFIVQCCDAVTHNQAGVAVADALIAVAAAVSLVLVISCIDEQ